MGRRWLAGMHELVGADVIFVGSFCQECVRAVLARGIKECAGALGPKPESLVLIPMVEESRYN